jgi:hypothetical protein
MKDDFSSLRYDLLAALEEVMVDGQVLQSTLLDPRAGPSAYTDACRFYSAVDSVRRLALLVCTATAADSLVQMPTNRPAPVKPAHH